MTLQELQAKMERWRVEGPKVLKVTLTRAAEMVRKEAQGKHLSGPRMPRGVGDSTSATLAVPTGRLRGSIAYDVRVSKDELRARVGTNVWYGRLHELGLAAPGRPKMPERPFLRPSLAAQHDRIFAMIEADWMASYG